MSDRRASCALERPGTAARIDSAVYSGTLRPKGSSRRRISRRTP